MGEKTMDLAPGADVEAILRDEIVREARAMAAVVPVLRHLLSSEAKALVSDAVLARVGGMIQDLAAQLIAVCDGHDPGIRAHTRPDSDAIDQLAERLMADEDLLGFCHALAAEGLIADRLFQRHAIDPVLSPLLQELIASEDSATAALAMQSLAAQSRFMQRQRRMELPLGELPAELFHRLLSVACRDMPDAAAFSRMQASYDEGASRLGLLARLAGGMRRGVVAALALDHAGLALFASALALSTRSSREGAVLACHEGQSARLALLLRATDVSPAAIERQILIVEPSGRLPRGLAELTAEQAATLLAGSGFV
ncbi:hypothetical protein CHX26_11340 [Porphyrobacter sp. HT-58-2]|nr:hypothetical protein CHX26_11340 [Porphyrobacter sp. HT-58-2]